ncbi:MAG: hypothetical protein ACRDPY_33320 [Streptosporangiaceae bacterium]
MTAVPGDPGGARAGMRGESRDASTFTQIGTQVIQPPLYEQTLADRLRVLGADHPQTKIVRGNLAAARQHPQ